MKSQQVRAGAWKPIWGTRSPRSKSNLEGGRQLSKTTMCFHVVVVWKKTTSTQETAFRPSWCRNHREENKLFIAAHERRKNLRDKRATKAQAETLLLHFFAGQVLGVSISSRTETWLHSRGVTTTIEGDTKQRITLKWPITPFWWFAYL